MRIVIPGGKGIVGSVLLRHFEAAGHDINVLSRTAEPIANAKVIAWDGRTFGPWQEAIDGADVVINLAGRTVNCRYSEAHLKEIMDSRVESTRVVGEAIAISKRPPSVWLQMSTATIYAHRFDAANDEDTGIIGGSEPGVPALWKRSIDIALAWERRPENRKYPTTRKVAMRSAIVLSCDKGGAFDILLTLARRGLGGRIGNGRQYMSWIHEQDFARALEFLIESDLSGAVNIASPNPLPQAHLAHGLRKAVGARIGVPTPKWLLEITCLFMQTESELVLKERRGDVAKLQDQLVANLKALPSALRFYMEYLTVADDNTPDEYIANLNNWEICCHIHTALVRALATHPISTTIKTADLLDPYDHKPLSYSYDGKQIWLTIPSVAHSVSIKIPPDPPKD